MLNTRVIYIAGYGRSGSTILDILLSQSDQISGFGELTNLMENGWINNEYCSCGDRINECKFWAKIKKSWEESSPISVNEYIILQKRYLNKYSIIKLLKNSIFKSKKFKKFEESTILLYKLLSKNSDKSYIIDSSKSPIRMYALKIMDINIDVIHLVRDGRAVANSLKRPLKKDLKKGIQEDINSKTVYKTILAWMFSNMLVRILSNKLNYLVVRYEDLINDGERTIKNIEKKLDINLQPTINKIRNNEVLNKEHIAAGNRLRMQDNLKFKGHIYSKWNYLSSREVKIINKIAGRSLKKYNYLL